MNSTSDKNTGFGNESAGKHRQEFGEAAGADKKGGLHEGKGAGQQFGGGMHKDEHQHGAQDKHADANKKPSAERDYKS